MKDDSGSYVVSTEHKSSALQMTAIHRAYIISITNDGCISNGYYTKTTRMRTTSSRRTISLHPAQNGRCTDVIGNSKVKKAQIFGYVYQNTIGQNHGLVWKIQSFFLNEICTVTFLASVTWERQFEKIL